MWTSELPLHLSLPLKTQMILLQFFDCLNFIQNILFFYSINHHAYLCAKFLMLFCQTWTSLSGSAPLLMYLFLEALKDWVNCSCGSDKSAELVFSSPAWIPDLDAPSSGLWDWFLGPILEGQCLHLGIVVVLLFQFPEMVH